jgi:hypothetical protein
MVYNYVQSQFLGTAYADGTVVRELLVCSHLTDSSKSDLIAPELRGGVEPCTTLPASPHYRISPSHWARTALLFTLHGLSLSH